MFDIEFEYVYFLAIPLLFLVCERYCAYKPASIYFAHISLIKSTKSSKNKIAEILKWLAIIFASIALSSPVIIDKNVTKDIQGFDIVVSLDASGSMSYPFKNSKEIKFQVAKSVITDFIKNRVNDNIGAVAFGRYAFIISPLSYDKKAVSSLIDMVEIKSSFSTGTAIGDSIIQSIRLLKNSSSKNKIIILATDGSEEGNVVVSWQKVKRE